MFPQACELFAAAILCWKAEELAERVELDPLHAVAALPFKCEVHEALVVHVSFVGIDAAGNGDIIGP